MLAGHCGPPLPQPPPRYDKECILPRFAAQPRRRSAALHYRRGASFRHMTEAQARALLRAGARADRLEHWIAAQPWQPFRSGWEVGIILMGWLSRIESVPPRLRLK